MSYYYMIQMQKTLKAKPMYTTTDKINPRSRRTELTKYPSSLTIPGQALKPAELLKRHLAGTLPDIDLSQRYEYHYDSEGKQVSEPLPLELHEVHKLSVAIRKRQYEEAIEAKRKAAEKHKNEIIDEYVRLNPDKFAPPNPTPKTSTSSKPGEPKPGKGKAAL